VSCAGSPRKYCEMPRKFKMVIGIIFPCQFLENSLERGVELVINIECQKRKETIDSLDLGTKEIDFIMSVGCYYDYLFGPVRFTIHASRLC
jgi:hypothetical protein